MCGIDKAIGTIGAIGSIISGVDAYNTAKASAKAAEYQEDIYRQNAQIAEQNAVTTKQSGIDDARRIKLQTLSNIATQKVAMAANGIDIDEGSALDLTDTTKYFGEMDALTTVNNAQSRASAYESEGLNFLSQAGLSSLLADNYRKSSFISGLGSGMTGLGQVGSSWYNWNKTSTSLPAKTKTTPLS